MKAICSSRSVAFPTVNPLAPRLNHYAYINENSKSLLRCIVGFKNKSKPRRPRLTAALEGSESNIGDDHGIGEKNGVSSSSEGSDDQGKIQSVTWRQFLEEAARLVRTNIWVLLLIHFTCDSLVFVLHRLSHRLTNELAISVLPSFDPSSISNMWWLTADPSIANFQTGYQTLTILVFLLAFPLNVLLKSFASMATIITCNDTTLGSLMPDTAWWNVPAGLWRAVPLVKNILASGISKIWLRVFAVEMLVSAAVIPLQFASLAVITLPLTLPIILSLYVAIPSAVIEGSKGWKAIQRSRQLIKPLRWDLAIPFVGLVAGQRLLESVKDRIMATLPARIYRELIEIPVVIVVGWWIASILLARMQDVLPFVAFNAGKSVESSVPS